MNFAIKAIMSSSIITIFYSAGWASSDPARNTGYELARQAAIGGAIAAAEVAMPGQPFTYAMNQAIKNQPLIARNAYKGGVANAIGQIPITATQMATSHFFKQQIEGRQNQPVTPMQQTTISAIAGVCGSTIDTPSNAIQLFQQTPTCARKGVMQSMRELGCKNAMRGFTPNAVKEAGFTVGYQALAETNSKIAKQLIDNQPAANIVGGVSAGVATAVITQPWAVMRNTMQADINRTHTTTWKTAQHLYQTQGTRGFFKGLPARGTRIAIAIPLYTAYSKIFDRWTK